MRSVVQTLAYKRTTDAAPGIPQPERLVWGARLEDPQPAGCGISGARCVSRARGLA